MVDLEELVYEIDKDAKKSQNKTPSDLSVRPSEIKLTQAANMLSVVLCLTHL